MAGLAAFLPAIVRAVAPRLGAIRQGIGRGFRKVQEAPYIGTRTPSGKFDPATTGFGSVDDNITSAAMRRGAALRLGLGGIEAGAAADAFTDEESTLFDKAIGATYGLGAFQFGRRGYQMARAANLGRGVPEATRFGKNIELAQVPAFAGDVLLGGPREVDIAQASDQEKAQATEANLGQLNPNQRKILNDFLTAYPEGSDRKPSQEVRDKLGEALRAAQDQKPTEIKKDEQIVPPTTQSSDQSIKQKEQVEKEIKEVDKRETIYPDSDDNAEIDKTVNAADKSAKQLLIDSKGSDTKYSDIADGPIADMFDALRVKKSDYERSDAAIKEYQEKIVANASKIKSFDEYKKQYDLAVGDGDNNLKNVTMLKWGLSLMQATSNQGGLAGAIDAVAKASTPFAEDLQAIAMKEKEENKALALRYMQYEKEAQENLNQAEQQALAMNIQQIQRLENAEIQMNKDFITMQAEYLKNIMAEERLRIKAHNEANAITDKMEIRTISDPTAVGGQRNILFRIGKQDGMPRMEAKDANGRLMYVPLSPEMTNIYQSGEAVERDAKGLRDTRRKLFSINEGFRYNDRLTEIIEKGDLKPGVQASFAKTLQGLSSFIQDSTQIMGRSVGGTAGSSFDAKNPNIDNMMAKTFEGYKIGASDEYLKENGNLTEQFRKDIREAKELGDRIRNGQATGILNDKIKELGIQGNYDRDEVAQQVADMLLIEQRMKYILANANKGSDRLTVADVDNAGQRTKLFSFFAGSRTITNTYKSIREDLEEAAQAAITEYISYGGLDRGLNNFTYLPQVRARNARLTQMVEGRASQQGATTNEQATENVINALGEFFQ